MKNTANLIYLDNHCPLLATHLEFLFNINNPLNEFNRCLFLLWETKTQLDADAADNAPSYQLYKISNTDGEL